MVSEDSQNLGWFAVIHRLSDLRDLDDSRHCEMPTEMHELDDSCELLEVLSLRRSQWVLLEERDDDVSQVTEPLHAIPEHVLPMIVVPAVSIHLSASEESDEVFQNVTARRALCDGEFRSHLPSQRHFAATVDGRAETALAVHETHDPSDGREPFLLVFRTPSIVTARHQSILRTGSDTRASSRRCSAFPAYGRLHSHRHRREGQRPLPAKGLPTLGPL